MEDIKEAYEDFISSLDGFHAGQLVPNGHVSDLNIPRCHLLYCILKDDYFVDVAKIICHEIYKFARFEIGPNNQKTKGTLGVPCSYYCPLCKTWYGG